MEFLDKENQLIAVEKVLEEMQKAEEVLKVGTLHSGNNY